MTIFDDTEGCTGIEEESERYHCAVCGDIMEKEDYNQYGMCPACRVLMRNEYFPLEGADE